MSMMNQPGSSIFTMLSEIFVDTATAIQNARLMPEAKRAAGKANREAELAEQRANERQRAWLRLMQRHGIDTVPRVLGVDGEHGYALLSWIEGSDVAEVSDADIDAAIVFLTAIHGLRAAPWAAEQPPAAEACLNGREIERQIQGRLERLCGVPRDERELIDFIDNSVAPRLAVEGPYALQAAIAACHARARTPEETNWQQIMAHYGDLARLTPSPVVELNRAVALAMAYGPAAGLELVDALISEPSLESYHLLPSVRGDLLQKLGRIDEARAEFERAAGLTHNSRERELLLGRARACGAGTALSGRNDENDSFRLSREQPEDLKS